ncbi:RNHCP domain-containing protein [Anoxynatronum buryatiense]|uniref:RNHCP domain-containing protein n=1 Tax=Anoxynatronum buryatiense TaxID=489973 RepID=A0AA46AIQ0_9CLOT|nr:RNHCP domain-containing protein [Anoxynatronum buryatiense]SMP53351.1 RNHCP domain-containing protein [Anoxynatronum buryatiense]
MRYTEKRKTTFKHHPCHDSFICKACGKAVAPEGAGTKHRNHCPECLSSLHVDHTPGDRAADCDGIMDPIGVWVRKNGEWAIIHRCTRCGHMGSNRLAADDNPIKLMSIALKPLASPPFPIEGLTRSLEVSPGKEGGRVIP